VVLYTMGLHLSLATDDATAWQTAPVGSATVLQNSQCTVYPALASASPSGNTWTVTVPVTCAASYAGDKQVRLYAVSQSGPVSGWQLRGTWTARAQIDYVSPASGSADTAVTACPP
jgi:hypothetical protein